MVDDIAPMNEFADDRGREYRLDDQVELGAIAQVLHVCEPSGGEIVEGEDLPAVIEQDLAEVGADEAGAAGDESGGLP